MPVDGSAYAGILTRYIDSDAFEAGGKNCFHDAGPHYYGQRYTPKGGARGIYMAEDVPTALGEVRQNGLAALCPGTRKGSFRILRYLKLAFGP
ncbi:MAG: RES domain-containing protein [Opitutales bacterium]